MTNHLPHFPSQSELTDLFRTGDTYPGPLRHHRTECVCRPDLLLDPNTVHDALIMEEVDDA